MIGPDTNEKIDPEGFYMNPPYTNSHSVIILNCVQITLHYVFSLSDFCHAMGAVESIYFWRNQRLDWTEFAFFKCRSIKIPFITLLLFKIIVK